MTSNIQASSPRLDYRINFTQTGTYYLWLRGSGANGNDDSVHAGLDGTVVANHITSFGTSASWTKRLTGGTIITFNVATTGIHTFNLWMREDGLKLDKIVLSKSSSYSPTGMGPAQSAST